MLESELLLAKVLSVSRSALHAYPERQLQPQELAVYEALEVRRQAGEPMAYLLGAKEFWSLTLEVTPDTLIPRPETELLVEKVLEKLAARENACIADVGTGSGAIALALAKEHPAWELWATEKSSGALDVAKRNAKRLGITNIQFILGDFCSPLPIKKFDVIVSNPPYIAENDDHLKDLRFEPEMALVSGADGLEAIKTIIATAKDYLQKGGWLMLEHGYNQGNAVLKLMAQAGYEELVDYFDYAGHGRVAVGRI